MFNFIQKHYDFVPVSYTHLDVYKRQTEGSVLVKELSELFDVTEDSIRKDLSLLEKKGLLKKTYGGAVKNRVNTHELYVSQRKGKNVEEKKEIARKAFELIEEGDVIFLDISTINIELIKLIVEANLKITVVTNMIDVMLGFTAPVSYTHLDVYKRQVQFPIQRLTRFE